MKTMSAPDPDADAGVMMGVGEASGGVELLAAPAPGVAPGPPQPIARNAMAARGAAMR